jgi:signal transduction histidine kinase
LLSVERLAMVGEIDLACDRLEGVIEQLLESARLMQGVTPLQLHPHDLLQLTNVAIAQREAARPIGATLAPTIIVSHNHDLTMLVSVDGRLLTLAMGHLLQNARNASSTEQSITVTMHTTGDTVEWSVRDQGVGIAADHLQHICKPFYRVATDVTSDMGGLGLGLTLSQRVIGLHGSVLQGESQLGQGSRFWFTLPLITTVG